MKSRKQRRAAAVERLRKADFTVDEPASPVIVKALTGSDTFELCYAKIVDLLSEDECHDAAEDSWMFECSECGTTFDIETSEYEPTMLDGQGRADTPNYCPNCGARVTPTAEPTVEPTAEVGGKSSESGTSEVLVGASEVLVSPSSERTITEHYGADGDLQSQSLVSVRPESETTDSREKLEADVYETMHSMLMDGPYGCADDKCRAWIGRFVTLLDRQAAITKRQCDRIHEIGCEQCNERRNRAIEDAADAEPTDEDLQSQCLVSVRQENETGSTETREKLEADVMKWWHSDDATDENAVFAFLDRQASITESEYYAFWAIYKHDAEEEIARLTCKLNNIECVLVQNGIDYEEDKENHKITWHNEPLHERDEEIAKLTRERDELKYRLDRATGESRYELDRKEWALERDVLVRERDAWRDSAEDMRYERDELKRKLDSCVELPVDAEGEYIHVGDVLQVYGDRRMCCELRLDASGWTVYTPSSVHDPQEHHELHHWHPRGKDGQPILRGDVVYGEDGVEYTVTSIVKDKKHCIVGQMADGHCKFLKPEWLTHDKPKTVADMLSEFASKYDRIGGSENEYEAWAKLLDEYVDKLQIKGDA